MVEHSSMKKLFHQFTDTHTHMHAQVRPQQVLGDAACSGTVWPTPLGAAEMRPVHTCCNNNWGDFFADKKRD